MSKVDTGRSKTFGDYMAKIISESEAAGNSAAGMDAGADPKSDSSSNIASTRTVLGKKKDPADTKK